MKRISVFFALKGRNCLFDIRWCGDERIEEIMSEYKFKGFSWAELAECWGLELKEQPFTVSTTDGEMVNLGNNQEEIEKVYRINGTTMKVTLTDEEEVQAEKIKQFIWSNLNEYGEFINSQIRTDIHNYLKALIIESKEIDYNTPVYEGLLKIENDHALTTWITSNLEMLWKSVNDKK